MRYLQLNSFSKLALTLAFACATQFACKSEIDGKSAAKVGPAAQADNVHEAGAKPPQGADKPAEGVRANAGQSGEPAKAPAGADATAKELNLDAQASSVGFVGAKITGDHKGDFGTISGKCKMVDGKLSAIAIEVDLASVKSDAEKLTGHLKSPDFFDVEKFPKATFTSTALTPNTAGGNTHSITGDLDLHGVKKPITFAAKIESSADSVKGTAEFTINRKDFNIVYPGKPDDLIKDDVLLKLNLACKS